MLEWLPGGAVALATTARRDLPARVRLRVVPEEVRRRLIAFLFMDVTLADGEAQDKPAWRPPRVLDVRG